MSLLRSLRVLRPFSKAALISSLYIRRNLSIFPRSIINQDSSSFPPVLRLLDEFDKYSRSIDQPLRSVQKSFTPKFDIRETPASYELQGELPGIDQKDIEIEFSNTSTITISGRTQSVVQSSDSDKTNVATDDAKDKRSSTTSLDPVTKSKDSTIEQGSSREAEEDLDEGPLERVWLMECSEGEFSRSFTFPSQVDENNVSARMNNGILKITVPKLKKQPGRKILIR